MITKLPTWLDPATEVKDPSKPKWFADLTRPYSDAVFYLWSVTSLLAASKKLGGRELDINQALEVTANFGSETLHGDRWSEFNWGGVKINSPYVKKYKETHNNVSPRWFSAKGHVKSGDAETVYYTAFDSVEQYCEDWLEKFVLITSKDYTGRYAKTAKAFWEKMADKDKHWFYELCTSGYKGQVTAKNPMPSVETLFGVERRIRVYLAQLLLEVKTDGDFGAKSQQACKLFQEQNNLKVKTGEVTDETLAALVKKYQTDAAFALKFKFRF